MGDNRTLEARIAKAEQALTRNPNDQRAAEVLRGLYGER